MSMAPLSLSELDKRYKEYLEKGHWDSYITDLCEDGLKWWFNMDTPAILTHLAPLEGSSLKITQLPIRLRFISEASNQPISLERMERFYRRFTETGDLEGAAAAAGAGVASIWDSGNDFLRYNLWYKRINELLKDKKSLSPLAICSLLGFKGLIDLTGRDIKRAYDTYSSLRLVAERAGSYPLMVYYAAASVYCMIWMGRLSEAEVVIKDAEALCSLPEVNIVVKIYFETTRGLFYFLRGEGTKAEGILREVVNLPFFESLPPPAYFLGYGHLLLTVARSGEQKTIESVAQKLRNRVIPEQNYFHTSYMHYNLATAYLMAGDPYRALIHAREAMERAGLSKSKIAQMMPPLAYGQALADTNNYTEAIGYLKQWVHKWKSHHFCLLASSGCLEVSSCYLKRGMVEEAREYFERATSLMPEGEEMIHLNRPCDFFEKIKTALYPPERCVDVITEIESKPICITTFGDLQIRLGDVVVYDRKWKGGRTKALLKALIVFGGSKISYELLIDTLWPDTDGDIAENNLKVALSRLRRIGCPRGERPMRWILVKQRKVSLARPICTVDSIIFKETIDRIFKTRDDVSLLMEVLDLYRDDFLPRDHSEVWIIRHRELLREEFIQGTILLSEMCKEEGNIKDSLPYLHRALEKDPLNEEVYATLMELYIESGYPSKAIQTYRQAEEILRKELDISPGPRLQQLARQAGMKI